MFVFKGKEYGSKADVVRELYDTGTVTLAAQSKKDIATALEMTVQTVHATIMKHIGKVGGSKPEKVKKITPAVVQATNRLNQKIAKVRSTNGAIFINDKSDEVREELMKDKRKFAILDAPNQYGLPVCNPPLYVIDENYDPDWKPEPDELIEKAW
jgi:hypothetical protein